jgi:competence protein ComEA
MIRKLYVFLFICLAVLLSPLSSGVELLSRQKADISVEVKGEAENCGIYTLPPYSTLADLLQLIRLSENADTSMLNYNTVLKDNDVINIPARSEVRRVSINTATLEELMSLPQIGQVTAQRIIDYRNSHGFFQQLEDIKAVKGIGDKTFEKIRDLICL